MDHVSGLDRHQMMMTSFDQLVHPQSFARIIDALAGALELSSFGFSNATLKDQGRPPYHPSDLLKLYLYGYQHGIRSCRKLEPSTKVNVEVMWLIKGKQPHYKTIANFRKENAKPFRQVFRQFIAILKDWKLVEGKEVAIDSFKIRAQNSLKNNYNAAKIDRHLNYIDNKINEYMEQLDAADDEGERKAIQDKMDHQVNKWNNYCELEEQLIESGEDQLSTTDPDARAVVLHRNIVNVGYNIQSASDGKHKMIVALDTGSVNDTHALTDMVEKVQQNLSLKRGKRTKVLADKGYHTGIQLAACEKLKVTTYVSPKANSANKRYEVYPMEEFKYHAPSDTYRCPNNNILRSNGKTYFRNGSKGQPNAVPFKHYKTKACKGCPLKSQCTSSERGRTIQRSAFQSHIDRNNKRVNNAPDYYRQRQQIIEHQFGTIKRQWGFTHALMRGKQNVLAEASIIFTAYNLRRSVSVLGFNDVMERLERLVFGILGLPWPVGRHVAVYLSLRQGRLWSRVERSLIKC